MANQRKGGAFVYCQYCGHEIQTYERYCKHCGALIQTETLPFMDAPAPEPEAEPRLDDTMALDLSSEAPPAWEPSALSMQLYVWRSICMFLLSICRFLRIVPKKMLPLCP